MFVDELTVRIDREGEPWKPCVAALSRLVGVENVERIVHGPCWQDLGGKLSMFGGLFGLIAVRGDVVSTAAYTHGEEEKVRALLCGGSEDLRKPQVVADPHTEGPALRCHDGELAPRFEPGPLGFIRDVQFGEGREVTAGPYDVGAVAE